MMSRRQIQTLVLKKMKEECDMELRRIEKSDYPYIKTLYTEAFPPDERAPFRMICKKAERGKGDFWVICEEGQSIGLAYLVAQKDLAYLFYYAIDPSERGKGYGTRALKEVLKMYENYRLFLALENWKEDAENKEQRIKRHSFYLNCGLHDLPYRIKEVDMVYSIMGSKGPVEPEEYRSMMNRYVGFPMRLFFDMRIIKD